MKAYTNVSRKTVGEVRVAICPNFGCEFMTRVKPLKLRFFGFGKYPKCKKHHIPLVYVDQRIGDFVDAALSCLFDKAGLPPRELIESVKSRFLDEMTSFVEGWVYCITVGRGAPIVSRYMDTISNAYLKQLTKKQIKAFKKGDNSKPNLVNKAIKDGMDEIAIQYARILRHLRAHSEILSKPENLKPLSKHLQKYLNEWQKNMLKSNELLIMSENNREMGLKEIKSNYDQILNIGTCRCLLGLNPESKEIKKAKVSAFDRFSTYHEFFKEDLTSKFTKSDVFNLLRINNNYQKGMDEKSENFETPNFNEELRESFNNELKRKFENSMKQGEGQPREIKKIDIIALEHYKEFIENQFLNVKNMKFISKGFLENLVKQIKSHQGDLPDIRILKYFMVRLMVLKL